MTNMLPERRRGEGIGYWGLATVAAIAVAPTVGFWIYRHGWWWLCAVAAALNMLMGVIAFFLTDTPAEAPAEHERSRGILEWRGLVVSFSLFFFFFWYCGENHLAANIARGHNPEAHKILIVKAGAGLMWTLP